MDDIAMKESNFQSRLVKLAGNIPPDDRVPYAFEKRIMARIKAGVAIDPLALWGKLLWRSVIPCMGIMLLTTIIASFTGESDNYAPDLESAVLEPITLELDSW
jgi:hypothetical protein